MSWWMFAGPEFSAIESSFSQAKPSRQIVCCVARSLYRSSQSLSESAEQWQKAQWRRLSPSPILSLYLWACDECMQGPLPHIHLTLLTQYKMWWSTLPRCWASLTQHSSAQPRRDLFPQPWKSKRAIKITGVWGPHDSLGTIDNVTLLHGSFWGRCH